MQQISYNSVEDITDDIRKQIGWRIQEKRIEKGITAVDLSTYLNITLIKSQGLKEVVPGLIFTS